MSKSTCHSPSWLLLSADELLPDLLVANTDVTIQAPINEYYQNLGVRLEELKREFTKIEARTGYDQTFEDYIQGDKEFAEGVQQNSQRYYDALKVLRADTQVCSVFPIAFWVISQRGHVLLFFPCRSSTQYPAKSTAMNGTTSSWMIPWSTRTAGTRPSSLKTLVTLALTATRCDCSARIAVYDFLSA